MFSQKNNNNNNKNNMYFALELASNFLGDII